MGGFQLKFENEFKQELKAEHLQFMRMKRLMLSDGSNTVPTIYKDDEKLETPTGGYDWSCGAMDAMESFFRRSDVQTAMHLNKPGVSRFDYRSSGPASITLYPELVKNMRVLIYNGDSDACVPYKVTSEHSCLNRYAV